MPLSVQAYQRYSDPKHNMLYETFSMTCEMKGFYFLTNIISKTINSSTWKYIYTYHKDTHNMYINKIYSKYTKKLSLAE